MTQTLTRERAKEIVRDILSKANGRFKQEINGENDEFLERVLVQFRSQVARFSWKSSQRWSKWDNDGPVLMPDNTRIYYRKGKTEILLQEFPPQVRLMKFAGKLAKRDHSQGTIHPGASEDGIYHYSLALPYVVFIFRFVDGMFHDVRCFFNDRPLKRLEEKPLRPYLSNLDSPNMMVCLGSGFPRDSLEKDRIAQQSALVLDNFWHTSYRDEWGKNFWENKAHFQQNDQRLATLENWQEASIENPLFVIDDVKWMPMPNDNNFGDIIVSMFEDDMHNNSFQNDLYKEMSDAFFEDLKKTFSENIGSAEQKVLEPLCDQLADELINALNGA